MNFTQADVDSLLKSNPELSVVGDPVIEKKRKSTARIPSRLEEQFFAMWKLFEGPELEEEFRFNSKRRWRADLAHLPSRTLIEIEGGTYSGGRHVRGQGYEDDCKKYNAATMAGWRVIRFTAAMIQPNEIKRLIEFIN